MKNRKSIRLKNYDYSSTGFYFITICVKNRNHAFGRVENGKMILSDAGKIADECWKRLPDHYPNCRLDEFVVMPNHFHGIVEIVDPAAGDDDGYDGDVIDGVDIDVNADVVVGTGFKPVPTDTTDTTDTTTETETAMTASKNKRFHGLTEIIRGFKTFSSRKINEQPGNDFFQWQRSYHDRIVRDAAELKRIRKYIIGNPLNWNMDIENGVFQYGYQSIMEYYLAIVSG